MIPNKTISHQGNLGSENQTAMTFDENSIAHLMSVLTDLYSDTETAVIREYSTNARDSHIAAGKGDVPIEVQMPTQFRPEFVVRDFGIGLSRDEVEQNLSKYGWSSKRGNNDETGMLGLGSKSGLTYASQFTYDCVKDGRRTVVLVTRSPEGGGVVQVMLDEETEMPNGVTVTIPVTDVRTFTKKATEFFKWWSTDHVELIGAQHQPLWSRPDAFWIDDMIVATPSQQYERDYVVMGGVAYPVPPADDRLNEFKFEDTVVGGLFKSGITDRNADEFVTRSFYRRDGLIQGLQLVLFVPVGTFDFTPSREELVMNKAAIETLAELKFHACIRWQEKMQEELDALPRGKVMDWLQEDRPGTHDLKWRGEVVPMYGFPLKKGKVLATTKPVGRGQDRASSVQKLLISNSWEGASLDRLHFHVYGYEGATPSKALRAAARSMLDQHGVKSKRLNADGSPSKEVSTKHHILFSQDRIENPWINDIGIKQFDAKAVLPPQVTKKGKPKRVIPTGIDDDDRMSMLKGYGNGGYRYVKPARYREHECWMTVAESRTYGLRLLNLTENVAVVRKADLRWYAQKWDRPHFSRWLRSNLLHPEGSIRSSFPAGFQCDSFNCGCFSSNSNNPIFSTEVVNHVHDADLAVFVGRYLEFVKMRNNGGAHERRARTAERLAEIVAGEYYWDGDEWWLRLQEQIKKMKSEAKRKSDKLHKQSVIMAKRYPLLRQLSRYHTDASDIVEYMNALCHVRSELCQPKYRGTGSTSNYQMTTISATLP